jgi:DNA-binding NtrC family response regulator
VLVAEDDPAMRDLLASALRDDGHEVLEARDGVDLLRLLATTGPSVDDFPVDVIVSDVRMPGTSGMEALTILRRFSRSLPVVLITAFGDLATHAEATRLGAAAVFDKPFDIDQLRSTVSALTGTRR